MNKMDKQAIRLFWGDVKLFRWACILRRFDRTWYFYIQGQTV